jgi:hypothetical protein
LTSRRTAQIIFDRLRDNSDIVLIDLPATVSPYDCLVKSPAWSIAHSSNERAGRPVTSSVVDVTSAGSPTAAAYASRSMSAAGGGNPVAIICWRADSRDSSSNRSGRRIASPMICTCSRCVRDAGPVITYSRPSCASLLNACTATAAMSRSCTGAVAASA